MKKWMFALFCALLMLALAGCATVTSDNSFQGQAPVQAAVTQSQQSVETQQPGATQIVTPTATPQQTEGMPVQPTRDPNGGING